MGFDSLSKAKIPYSFLTEQLYHINGTSIESFILSKLIDLTNSKYKQIHEPILTEGIKIINGKK